jgi:hypothetical protein
MKKRIISLLVACIFAATPALAADRYWVPAGSGNFGDTNNWAASSGGASGQSVPTASDNCFFDGSSGTGTVIVNASARDCLALNQTGWGGTIQLDQHLTASGTMTLAGTFTAGAGGSLRAGATLTLTSNGVTIPSLGTTGNGITVTLADAADVVHFVPVVNSAGTHTFNGFSIAISGNFTCTASASTTVLAGTTTLTLDGTGTWSSSGDCRVRNSLTINTAGTITLGTTTRFETGTLTYTAGTMVVSGNTMRFGDGNTGYTINTSGMTWNDVIFNVNGTGTLSSDLNVGGDFTRSPGTSGVQTTNGNEVYVQGDYICSAAASSTQVCTGSTIIVLDGTGLWNSASTGSDSTERNPMRIAGSYTLEGNVNYDTGTIEYESGDLAAGTGAIINGNTNADMTFDLDPMVVDFWIDTDAGNGLILVSALTMSPTATLTCVGTAASNSFIRSSSSPTQRALVLQAGVTTDLGYCDLTDIDASGGETIWGYYGDHTNTVNTDFWAPCAAGDCGPDDVGAGAAHVFVQ